MKAVPGARRRPAETWPELHEEVARLPEAYREPVVLCYLEGLTTEEAALRIGCPTGTVLSRLSRARERLRSAIDPPGPDVAGSVAGRGVQRRPRRPDCRPALAQGDGFCLGGIRRDDGRPRSPRPRRPRLARGVLNAMMVSKLKLLGTAALVCTLALGGVRASGWLGRLDEAQPPIRSAPDNDDPQAALPARSTSSNQSWRKHHGGISKCVKSCARSGPV